MPSLTPSGAVGRLERPHVFHDNGETFCNGATEGATRGDAWSQPSPVCPRPLVAVGTPLASLVKLTTITDTTEYVHSVASWQQQWNSVKKKKYPLRGSR